MGGAVGGMIGAMIRQAVRSAGHKKNQQAGYHLIAKRLQLTIPWQPEMLNATVPLQPDMGNAPAFVCAHCQSPHLVRQTLLGCSACAAPYFPSEVMRFSKDSRLACVACAADQNVETMPFCCMNCRCIQGNPTNLAWRKTFSKLPVWRILLGPVIWGSIGILALLFCLISSLNPANHTDSFSALAGFGGLLPLAIGGAWAIAIFVRKKMPSEMMISCGGFGYKTPTGEPLWFSWGDVSGLDTHQNELDSNTGQAQADSTAKGWTIRMRQEDLFFDNRLEQAREYGRQIRMRSPVAPLADLAPLERQDPRLIVILIVGLILIIGILLYFGRP